MNKYVKGIIAGLLTVILSTGIAYALLSVTKRTDTITIKTASMDMVLGTPVVLNTKPISPGEILIVRVPVTNTNNFEVSIGSTAATVQEETWYESDGVTPTNLVGGKLTSGGANFILSNGGSSSAIPAGATLDLQVLFIYPSNLSQDYVDKTLKLKADIVFNQKY